MPVNKTANDQTGGSTMNTALVDDEQERIKRQQELGEEASAGASSGPTTIGGSSATQTSAPVKAMPKQQKAGTGSFANLKTYLQAAQGGGQQKVAQAATQQVQKLGAGAQKGVQQAQESFKGQLGAGSGAIFQGQQPGQYLSAEDAAKQAQATTGSVLGTVAATTYQAPQVQTQTQEQGATSQPTTTTQAPAQQYFKPEDLQAFANVINAQYQGPASLQQAGLYEQAARKARAAQQAGELTQTAGGREQLLRDVFGRGRDYSRGASRLDALLLNASEQGVQQLQQQAQPALQSQQALQAAQNLSANEAAQRAAAIEQIRSGARTAFTEARTAEETAAQDYITNIQENWNKLPEYFKQVLTQSATQTPTRIGDATRLGASTAGWNKYYDKFLAPGTKGTTYNLSAEEAAILGLSPGQGLFGVSPEMINAAPVATGAELITKDQLSRQLALAQLAELDRLGGLKKDLQYTDLEKAGTKDLISSLDTDKLRRVQEENRKNMEEAVARMGSVNLGTPSGYRPFAFSDILKSGGYTPLDIQGLTPEDRSRDTLQKIMEGASYTPTQATAPIENYIQKAFESPNYMRNFNTDQLVKWGLQPLQREISKYGAFDTIQQVENEQTATRAQALRDLIAGIYKK